MLSEEEKRRIEALGGWDKLHARRCASGSREQKERHEGGNKWIGTGGTSPFGACGYNPEGIRIGQAALGGKRRAVKVWEQREYRNFDDTRRARHAQPQAGAAPAAQVRARGRGRRARSRRHHRRHRAQRRPAGPEAVPERHNAVKVLLFLDVGGSMDDHVRVCEELFSAARSEFKHLEHFYFHNFLYEHVWKDNAPALRDA